MVTVKLRCQERIEVKRGYQFVFPCWKTEGQPEVRVNGDAISPEIETDGNTVKLKINSSTGITSVSVDWGEIPQVLETNYRQEIVAFLKEAQISFTQKEQIYSLVERYGKSPLIVQDLLAVHPGQEVYEVICELLWACG